MSKLFTIQTNVPMCPECGGAIRLNKITMKYQCFHCGSRYKVISQGHTEREFVCEKIQMSSTINS